MGAISIASKLIKNGPRLAKAVATNAPKIVGFFKDVAKNPKVLIKKVKSFWHKRGLKKARQKARDKVAQESAELTRKQTGKAIRRHEKKLAKHEKKLAKKEAKYLKSLTPDQQKAYKAEQAAKKAAEEARKRAAEAARKAKARAEKVAARKKWVKDKAIDAVGFVAGPRMAIMQAADEVPDEEVAESEGISPEEFNEDDPVYAAEDLKKQVQASLDDPSNEVENSITNIADRVSDDIEPTGKDQSNHKVKYTPKSKEELEVLNLAKNYVTKVLPGDSALSLFKKPKTEGPDVGSWSDYLKAPFQNFTEAIKNTVKNTGTHISELKELMSSDGTEEQPEGFLGKTMAGMDKIQTASEHLVKRDFGDSMLELMRDNLADPNMKWTTWAKHIMAAASDRSGDLHTGVRGFMNKLAPMPPGLNLIPGLSYNTLAQAGATLYVADNQIESLLFDKGMDLALKGIGKISELSQENNEGYDEYEDYENDEYSDEDEYEDEEYEDYDEEYSDEEYEGDEEGQTTTKLSTLVKSDELDSDEDEENENDEETYHLPETEAIEKSDDNFPEDNGPSREELAAADPDDPSIPEGDKEDASTETEVEEDAEVIPLAASELTDEKLNKLIEENIQSALSTEENNTTEITNVNNIDNSVVNTVQNDETNNFNTSTSTTNLGDLVNIEETGPLAFFTKIGDTVKNFISNFVGGKDNILTERLISMLNKLPGLSKVKSKIESLIREYTKVYGFDFIQKSDGKNIISEIISGDDLLKILSVIVNNTDSKVIKSVLDSYYKELGEAYQAIQSGMMSPEGYNSLVQPNEYIDESHLFDIENSEILQSLDNPEVIEKLNDALAYKLLDTDFKFGSIEQRSEIIANFLHEIAGESIAPTSKLINEHTNYFENFMNSQMELFNPTSIEVDTENKIENVNNSLNTISSTNYTNKYERSSNISDISNIITIIDSTVDDRVEQVINERNLVTATELLESKVSNPPPPEISVTPIVDSATRAVFYTNNDIC